MIDFARVARGWNERLELSSAALGGTLLADAPTELHEIAARAIAFSRSNQMSAPSTSINFQIAQVCSQFGSIQEQQLFLEQFGSSKISGLIGSLTIGSTFVPHDVEQTLALNLSDADYSIIATSQLLKEKRSRRNDLRKLVSDFLKRRHVPAVVNDTTLRVFLGSFGISVAPNLDLHGIIDAAVMLKQRHWALFCPEPLSLLQLLSDPNSEPTAAQLQSGYEIASVWKLHHVVAKYILLRFLGGYEPERHFAEARWQELRTLNLFDEPVYSAIEALLHGDATSSYIDKTYRSDLLARLVCAFLNAGLATAHQDLERLKKSFVEISSLSHRAVFLLDWHAIHKAFELPSIESSMETIAMKYVMCSDQVARRFLDVAASRGRGQLVADITSHIARLRDRFASKPTFNSARLGALPRQQRSTRAPENAHFVRQIKSLPADLKRELMEELLDKGMIERFAFSFKRSGTLPFDTQNLTDSHAGLVRIELARLASQLGVVTQTRFRRIAEEETRNFRMQRFHNLFRAGRIRVDWDYIQRLLGQLIVEKRQLVATDGVALDSSVVKNLAVLLALEITEILIFHSESSLEQALSNNLRHGVIVPRVVRAFNDALADTADAKRPVGTTDEAYFAQLGADAAPIVEAKNAVIVATNAFIEHWLRVERHGEFHTYLNDLVVEALTRENYHHPDTPPDRISNALLAIFRAQIESFLKEAAKQFTHILRPHLVELVKEVRGQTSQHHRTIGFIDSLQTHLADACNEIQDWIGLLKERVIQADFVISDLVQFETATLIFSDVKRLNVRFRSRVVRNGVSVPLNADFRIRGTYFEAFHEIIHNLIFNAYKHSGLELDTEIDMSLTADGEDLVFRCANTFAPAQAEKIVEQWPSVAKLIRAGPEKAASEEGLSGFQKIKHAGARIFGKPLRIDIPPVSIKSKAYLVEIRIFGMTQQVIAS